MDILRSDGSVQTVARQRRRKMEEETDDENWDSKMSQAVVDVVDCFPMPANRNKKLTVITARLFWLLHDMKWSAFDWYTNYLSNKKSKMDAEVEMLLHIYKVDSSRNTKQHSKVAKIVPEIEQLRSRTSSPSLCVRYLTTKAINAYFLGMQSQALSLQYEAIQMGLTQAPDNSKAYNMMVYALHNWLHRVDIRGYIVIPSDEDWRRAEDCLMMAYEHHVRWTADVKNDAYIPESTCASFRLYAYVRYIYCLVRSCVGGGFSFFTDHHCPIDNIRKALQCIQHVQVQEDSLMPKMQIEFALVQCDYQLRESERIELTDKDRIDRYKEAQSFAMKALYRIPKLGDDQYGQSYRQYVRNRVEFIKGLMKTPPVRPGTGQETGECSTREIQLSYISHMCPFTQSASMSTWPIKAVVTATRAPQFESAATVGAMEVESIGDDSDDYLDDLLDPGGAMSNLEAPRSGHCSAMFSQLNHEFTDGKRRHSEYGNVNREGFDKYFAGAQDNECKIPFTERETVRKRGIIRMDTFEESDKHTEELYSMRSENIRLREALTRSESRYLELLVVVLFAIFVCCYIFLK